MLSKHNGKTGCAGMRLIHLLDDCGKAWLGSLWMSKSKTWHTNSMGYVPGRRREEALVIMRAMLWQLT
eukprot:11545926-Heterocapsa_arctica.AAC.1